MDPHDLLKPKEKCAKIIGVSKYERTNPDIQDWWWRKFRNLEDKSSLPFYKRLKHLEECFSKETVKDLVKAGIEAVQDTDEDEIILEDRYGLVNPPSKSKLSQKRASIKKSTEAEEVYSNPYLNFMKKPKREAQIWRPKRKPTMEDMHLTKKAEIVEETIASEFDEWFSTVGSNKKSEIDKATILDIFQLIFTYPISTSLCARVHEVGAVPEVTAEHIGLPEKAEDACVRQQIRRDIRAGKLKPRVTAFNKTLPVELRRKPFTENLKAKWFEYQIRHQDLATMAAVWRGITDLQTTRSFCLWLLDHPEITPPTYLEKQGLLDLKVLNKDVLDIAEMQEIDWEDPAFETENKIHNLI